MLEILQAPWVEDRDEVFVLEIPVVTPMKGLFQEADRLWKELTKFLAQNQIGEAGPSYLRFRVIDMEGAMAVSVGVPVAGRPAGNGRVVPGTLPAGRYACLRYRGHGLVANKTLLGWIRDQGLVLDRWDDPAGDAFACRRETVLTDRRAQPLKKKWEMELSMRLADPVEYRSLEGEALETLHQAFVEAFSEYEVKVDLTVDQLRQMLETRSWSPAASVGCYDRGALVGFTLVGLRTLGGRLTAYDAATGLVPTHQGRGLARTMFDEVAGRLGGQGVTAFRLEVLENNAPAQKVYRDAGFQVSRKFLCFERPRTSPGADPAGTGGPAGLPDGVDEVQFCSFVPSWQNALASAAQRPQEHLTIVVRDDAGALAGYGIVHRRTGSVLQLGALPGPDREAVVGRVVEALLASGPWPKLRYLNVEEGSWIAGVLPRQDWSPFISQYEMTKTLD